MRSKMITLSIAASIALAAAFSAVLLAGTASAQSDMTHGDNSANATSSSSSMHSTVVRDSVLLTGPKTIPPHDFIHLYDSTPYMIMSGHVALKTSCDANYKTPLQVLVGQAPNLKPAEFELLKGLSKPGGQCVYHVDLVGGNNTVITDVALSNPTHVGVQLPATGGVFVGINEIMPGAEEGGHEHAGMEMGGGSSMNMTGGSMEGMAP